MTFFLDENFPKAARALLGREGHESVDIRGTEQEGADDNDLFLTAQDFHAVFLTTDKDFFHTIPLAFARHGGAIVITLRKPNRADLLGRLADALALLGGRDLRDTVWLVTDTRIRSRHAEIKK